MRYNNQINDDAGAPRQQQEPFKPLKQGDPAGRTDHQRPTQTTTNAKPAPNSSTSFSSSCKLRISVAETGLMIGGGANLQQQQQQVNMAAHQ